MRVEINTERLKKIEAMGLRQGVGKNLKEKLCVMQAVSYITSGDYSDHPECADAAYAAYAAYADAEQRATWRAVRAKIIDATLVGLDRACSLAPPPEASA